MANLTSPQGGTEWTYALEPFGSSRSETQDDPSAPTNVIKFVGQLADPTGLYYLRARQYDPDIGRFAQLDSEMQTDSGAAISRYAYAADRPTVMVDPSGRMFEQSDAGQSFARDVVSAVPQSCYRKGGGSTGERRLETEDVEARLAPIPWRMYYDAVVWPPGCGQAGWWAIESVLDSDTTAFSPEYGDYEIAVTMESGTADGSWRQYDTAKITPPHPFSKRLGAGWSLHRVYSTRPITRIRVKLAVARVGEGPPKGTAVRDVEVGPSSHNRLLEADRVRNQILPGAMKRDPKMGAICIAVVAVAAACASQGSKANSVTAQQPPFVTRSELQRSFAAHGIRVVLEFDYAKFDKRFPELASFSASDPRIGQRLEVFQCRSVRLAQYVAKNFSKTFAHIGDRVVLTRLNVVVIFDPTLRAATKTRIRAAMKALT